METDVGTIGALMAMIAAMGRYIIKISTDCAVERKEAWASVAELTSVVNEMAKEMAVDHALKRQ